MNETGIIVVEIPESMSDEGRRALRRAVQALVATFSNRAMIPPDDELVRAFRVALNETGSHDALSGLLRVPPT